MSNEATADLSWVNSSGAVSRPKQRAWNETPGPQGRTRGGVSISCESGQVRRHLSGPQNWGTDSGQSNSELTSKYNIKLRAEKELDSLGRFYWSPLPEVWLGDHKVLLKNPAELKFKTLSIAPLTKSPLHNPWWAGPWSCGRLKYQGIEVRGARPKMGIMYPLWNTSKTHLWDPIFLHFFQKSDSLPPTVFMVEGSEPSEPPEEEPRPPTMR